MAAVRVFTAPLRYVQGEGALDELGSVVAGRHARAVVLVDELLFESLRQRLLTSLEAAGVHGVIVSVAGEVTEARMQSLAAELLVHAPTVVIAVGGGKTLDTGKGVSKALGVRVVTVPTIASTDGATSRVIATYDDDHRLVATPTMNENPEAVVVDTGLVCAAPVRFLVSGMGDAVAKHFEAAACALGSGVTSNGTRPLALPLAIADACYRTLLEHGAAAVSACEAGAVTAELERVVEAVVLMSGLAFENGGLSLAHSMTRGLMALPGTAAALHGLQVAYGLLVQVTHEGRSEVAAELRAFYAQVGLPRSLRELGEELSDAAVATLTTGTLRAPHLANCVPTPDAASLTAAILEVEVEAKPER